MFRPAEVVKLFCLFHKDRRDNVTGGLQALGLVEFFDVKQRYPDLDMPKTPVDAVIRHLERVQTAPSSRCPLVGGRVPRGKANRPEDQAGEALAEEDLRVFNGITCPPERYREGAWRFK